MACERTNRPTLMQFAPNPSAGEPSTCSLGKTAKSCFRERHEALLLMLVFSRFHQLIRVECPARGSTDRLWCDSYQTQGQESPRLAVLGQSQKLLPGAKHGTFANAGIFQVRSVDSGEIACERTNRPTLMRFLLNPRSRETSTCSLGTTPKVAPWPKTRHFLLMLVFSRFQQWIRMEWPVKGPTDRLWCDLHQTQAQESPGHAITVKPPKVAPGSKTTYFC